MENRVQVIEYGSSFDELPAFLARLCPNPEKVVEERVRLVQLALGTGTADAVLTRVQSLRALSPLAGPAETVRTVDAEHSGGTISLRAARNARLRRELVDLQNLARDLVDVEDLRRHAKLGAAAGQSGDDMPSRDDLDARKSRHSKLREAAKGASAAIFLFTDELLGALDRRGVQIHPAVLSGFARQVIEMSSHSFDRFGLDDSYSQENMYRVISDLLRILDSDPSKVFTDLPPGSAAGSAEDAIVVARTGRLQLISVSSPSLVLAELPMLATFRCGAQVVAGVPAARILAHTEESVFIWNPQLAEGPTQELILDIPIGITRAVSCQQDGMLISVIQTFDGKLLRAYDLKDLEVIWESAAQPLSDPIVTADARIFARQGDEAIIEVLPGASLRPVMTDRQIIELIKRHPDLREPGDLRLTTMSLELVTFESREVIAVGTQLMAELVVPRGSAILFFDPAPNKWSLLGSLFLRDGVPMDYAVASWTDGRPRVWLCLLNSPRSVPRDLIVWCDGTRTRNGIVFRQTGSFGRHSDDLTRIVCTDTDRGFVGDGTGGLLSFSRESGELVEILRAPDSIIWSLERARTVPALPQRK